MLDEFGGGFLLVVVVDVIVVGMTFLLVVG